MDKQRIRAMLQSQGFTEAPGSLMDSWENQEGKLCFRAEIGVAGIGKEGLSINASYSDGRELYDSEGMLGRGVLSVLMHPAGFLGPDPALDDILARMEDIREEAGLGDPNVKALSEAIRKNDAATVKRLLNEHASFLMAKRRGPLRDTFLHNIHTRRMALALLSAGFDANAPDIYGNTPLHRASSPGVVSALLQYGADINKKNGEGNTPLYERIRHGQLIGAALLLHSGADPSLQNKAGLACLHVVISGDAVHLLMEYDANPNLIDSLGRTPLHYALNWEIGTLLVQGGANVTVDSKGAFPIHTAQTVDAAEYFIDQGMDAFAVDVDGQTPLHYAVSSNRRAVVKFLLYESGHRLLDNETVNAKDINGLTALHLVTDPMIARLLIQAGADVMARDVNQKTPLHDCSSIPIMKSLVAAGADVNATDVHGKTALHYSYGNRITLALLKLGANANATDNEGKTPLEYPKSIRSRALLRREMKRKRNK